jgi:hypothetical protein
MEGSLDTLLRLVEERAVSDSGLDRLRAAVALLDERRAQHEWVLDHFVAAARSAGCSWTEIGTTLGVSKQAAHQRFPAPAGHGHAWPPQASEGVRAAFAAAQDEARAMGHAYLGTEHVALGLLTLTGEPAGRALAGLGVEHDAVARRVREMIGVGNPRASAELRLTPRTKKALELARRHGKAARQRCIAGEHVLLGLVDLEEGVAAHILAEQGATPQTVRTVLAGLGVEVRAHQPRRRILRGR